MLLGCSHIQMSATITKDHYVLSWAKGRVNASSLEGLLTWLAAHSPLNEKSRIQVMLPVLRDAFYDFRFSS